MVYQLSDIVALYVDIVRSAVPVALVFGFGDLMVSTLLRVAFGGRLSFGRL